MKYLLFCTIAVLCSCTVEKPANVVISTDVNIFVDNNKGQNLLLKTTPNAINVDSLKLIYLVGGKMLTVYDPNMDCPRNTCKVTDVGNECIQIFPNDLENEEYPITYIRWGNGDLDTIKCHFIRKESDTNSSIVCDKVWFNNSLMFPDKAIKGFDRAFKIVK